MTALFQCVVHRSIMAGYAVIFVLLLRVLFKRVPKIFSYVLWGIVLFRLVCPISFSSPFSFYSPFAVERTESVTEVSSAVEEVTAYSYQSQIDIASVSADIGQETEAKGVLNGGSIEGHTERILSYCWIIGLLMLTFYSLVIYIRQREAIEAAVPLGDNIFSSDRIPSPFVWGIRKPKIYVPSYIAEDKLPLILAHEKVHIKRLDYIIKPFAYGLLLVHWFNPLLWAAFVCMGRDMEMSCDEAVLKKEEAGNRKEYANLLLSFSFSGISRVSPISFGGGSMKSRIKNIVRFRKAGFLVLFICFCLAAVLYAGLMTDPVAGKVISSGLPEAKESLTEKVWEEVQEENSDAIGQEIEENIQKIIVSPQTASNPYDYLKEHEQEYKNIVGYGEDALTYLRGEFEKGDNNDLRGSVMMILMKDLLGKRDTVQEDTLSPQQWFQALKLSEEIVLPDYLPKDGDALNKAVYEAVRRQNTDEESGFLVSSVSYYGVYEEEKSCKVFICPLTVRYRLYGEILTESGGSMIPSALTFDRGKNGEYYLTKYEKALDGSYWGPSIEAFCKLPVSGVNIEGLSEVLIQDNQKEEREEGLKRNLESLLRENGLEKVMENDRNKEIFSL